jgi:hypothetical protein
MSGLQCPKKLWFDVHQPIKQNLLAPITALALISPETSMPHLQLNKPNVH